MMSELNQLIDLERLLNRLRRKSITELSLLVGFTVVLPFNIGMQVAVNSFYGEYYEITL
jgi:hypothetical protein